MQQTQQARAPQPQPFGGEGFGPSDGTTLRWLGMAGFLINSRGTMIMVDPLLEGFDMPIMIHMPIEPCRLGRLGSDSPLSR
jgi:L-ascorbate metabolism protein UlaG (beta-lactamase superfamily)